MKKILALLLCAAVISGLCACSKKAEEVSVNTGAAAPEAPVTTVYEVPVTTVSEAEKHHVHVNYKGLSHIYTPEDMEAAEGRPCEFTAGEGEDTLYIYNNVTADGMTFSQVQHTFHKDYNRISCTYSSKTDTESMMGSFRETLTGIYGEAAHQEGHEGTDLWIWMDHTGNYVILTRINEDTIQVAYYIYAPAQ